MIPPWQPEQPIARRAAAVVFPVLLFAVAFFYLRGDLGRYYDDYVFAGRDAVRAATDWSGNPWRSAPYFWRPLLFPFLYYALAALWNSMAVMHALNVAVHACVALGLWVLLRRLTRSRAAAATGAMVFAFYPLHFDVVFWSTAITSSIPAGLVMVVCVLFVRYARGSGYGLLPGLAALAFVSVCWYEQPATVVPALTLLYMGACPKAQAWRTRVVRSGAAVVVMGGALCVYLALMFATVPRGRRGGAASIVPVAELHDRVMFCTGQIWRLMTVHFREYTLGAFNLGWQTVGRVRGMVVVLLVVLAAGVWVKWVARSGGEEQERASLDRPSQERAGRWWVAGFGASWWVLAWLPFVPVRDQWVTPRCFYVPMLGCAVVLAVAVDWLFERTRRWRAAALVRGAVGAGVAVWVVVCGVALVGWQAMYQARNRADAAQVADLVARVPNPPKDAVFVAFKDEFRAAATGRLLFDVGLLGWTGSQSTVEAMIKQAYRRNDVHCTQLDFWNPPAVRAVDAGGVSYPLAFAGNADAAGGSRISWERAVPFCIGVDGRIVLVDRLAVKRADGRVEEFVPPVVKSAAPGPARTLEWTAK
ncbi:MAG: hypothetical protein JSR77_03635 [Planctomycetes bacterium]|nr:hypothetical protein [Planctomycetota bacterium]